MSHSRTRCIHSALGCAASLLDARLVWSVHHPWWFIVCPFWAMTPSLRFKSFHKKIQFFIGLEFFLVAPFQTSTVDDAKDHTDCFPFLWFSSGICASHCMFAIVCPTFFGCFLCSCLFCVYCQRRRIAERPRSS